MEFLARKADYQGVKDVPLSEEEFQEFLQNMTEKEKKDLEEAFSILDKNGDNTVSREELADLMRSLGQNPTAHEIDAMFNEVDLNGTGSITYDEYLRVAAKYKKTENQVDEEMMDAFRVFDRDGDGVIDVHELRTVLCSLGDKLTHEEAQSMIEEGDVDADGKLDYHEFVKVMNARK